MTPVKYNVPFVFHFRNYERLASYPSHNSDKIASRGGLTVVFDPATKHFGAACCSRKDNYNRKLGMKIALGRANRSAEKVRDDTITKVLKNFSITDNEFFVETIRQKAKDIAAQFGY